MSARRVRFCRNACPQTATPRKKPEHFQKAARRVSETVKSAAGGAKENRNGTQLL